MSNFRPRFVQVIAKQWLQHGDHHEVRRLTAWESFRARRKGDHSTADMGMLVVGEQLCLVHPGYWVVHDDDAVRVLSNKDFVAMYLPTSLDPTLQELVDRLEDLKLRLGDKTDTIELIDSAVTGLYLQAEVISKCYAEKYRYDTRFFPQRK